MHDLKDLITRDINGLSVKEILNLIDYSNTVGEVQPLPTRVALIKMIYQLLSYDLNKELLYVTASEPRAQLILATAGAGKTTLTQLKLVLEKIIRTSPITGEPISGDRILCLVYNKHNVDDMVKRHKQLVNKLYNSQVKNLNIDSNIKAYTMHSFCEMWKNEYLVECGLVGATLLKDDEAYGLMKNVINVACMKEGKNVEKINIKDTLSLYNYVKESLVPYEEITNVDKFIDSGLEYDFVKLVFETYDKMKSIKNKFDFTDMLYKFRDLLANNEIARKRIQDYYDYITVDEIQDFTPIMMQILKYIVREGTPLVCIGDEDQSIYNFRGADIYNTLDFKSYFPGAEIYTLGVNRRCAKDIVEVAKSVVKTNTLRYQKTINARREGGIVELRPYANKQGQLINIVRDLMKMDFEDQKDTVICYRDRKSSLAISSLLEEKGIPFYTISGYNCFSHELLGHVTDILEMLYTQNEQTNMRALYKCTPARKEQIFSIVGYNAKKHDFTSFKTPTDFYNLNFGELLKSSPFVDAIEKLKNISLKMDKEPLNVYFKDLYTLMCKYFWNYKMSINKNDAIDGYFSDVIYKMFNVDMTYQQFRRELARRKEIVRANESMKIGVALSTFHGLKGLEFKNVYIIDLDEELFPNFALIESKNYPEETTLKLKEAETRLMYVAMTRAKDKLIMYYDESNPSTYIKVIQQHLNDNALEKDIMDIITPNKSPISNVDIKGSFKPRVGVNMLDRFK